LVNLLKEVSVVVSTYSKARLSYLLDCIESLRKQSFKPVEVILVLDPVPDLVEFYKSRLSDDVKIVVSENCGLSNARNAGVKSARGEIIAFIDDDAVADERWLKNLVKNYDDSWAVGVGGLIKPIWENNRAAWFPEELDWIVGCSYKGLPESKSYVRNPIGCNMSFRKDVFEKVGYFRTDIGRLGKKPVAGEEAEFSIRIMQKIQGSKIVYDPCVVVYHKVPKIRARLKYVVKRSFYEGFSKALITHFKSNPLHALSTEDHYLKYLLKVAIPSRLKRIHKFESISHLIILLISICSVSAGYIIGLLSKRGLNRGLSTGRGLSGGAPTAVSGEEYGVKRRFEVLQSLESFTDRKVLDVGCGVGAYSTVAKKCGARMVVGIDINREYVRKASLDNKLLADACALPFKGSCFDIILMIEVLEHLSFETKALKEVNRLLTENGLLLLSSPNKLYPFETHGLKVNLAEIPNMLGVGIPFLSWMPSFVRTRIEKARIYTVREIARLLRKTRFRLLIVDYMMPPLDKLSNQNFARALRKILRKLEATGLKRFGCHIIIVASKYFP